MATDRLLRMMWGTTYTTSTLRYVDNVAVGRDQYQSFSHVLCLRQCNYGFSFPNYLDRMFGTEWPDYEPLYLRVNEEKRPLTKLREKVLPEGAAK